MTPILTVDGMAKRYGVSRKTAIRYIRQINPHMEKPLAVYVWAAEEWEQSRTVGDPASRPVRREEKPVIVPRKRKRPA